MSFIKDYMVYTSGNEAHKTYHLFSCLVALSSIISRRVWIDMGYFEVYPNLYVVLVGPPGGRKTTAMSICKKLIRELADIPFSAECVTKEKLVVDMSEFERAFTYDQEKPPVIYTPLTVCVTELSQFLGASSAHMVDFLTTVYDQNFYDLKTKNKGSQTITGPYLTLLACTTPAWITARLRDDVISGGFSRRAIFVYESEDGERIAFPEITDEMKAAWDRVMAYSRQLMGMGGPFTWAPDAKAYHEDWYKKYVIPKDPMVSGYYRSKHIQLLKIAMLHSLSESPDMVMRIENLLAAKGILELTEPNLPKVFEGIGRNELNKVASAILEILQDGKPTLEKEVFRAMFREATNDELFRIVNHLIATDRIQRYVQKGDGDKVPDRFYLKLK